MNNTAKTLLVGCIAAVCLTAANTATAGLINIGFSLGGYGGTAVSVTVDTGHDHHRHNRREVRPAPRRHHAPAKPAPKPQHRNSGHRDAPRARR